jgi:hypothetical protein
MNASSRTAATTIQSGPASGGSARAATSHLVPSTTVSRRRTVLGASGMKSTVSTPRTRSPSRTAAAAVIPVTPSANVYGGIQTIASGDALAR